MILSVILRIFSPLTAGEALPKPQHREVSSALKTEEKVEEKVEKREKKKKKKKEKKEKVICFFRYTY